MSSKKKVSDFFVTIGPISPPDLLGLVGLVDPVVRKHILGMFMIPSHIIDCDLARQAAEQDRLWREENERVAMEFGITVEQVRALDNSHLGPIWRAACRSGKDDTRRLIEISEKWVEEDKA